ncbi:MAG: hypothetical protein IH948_02160 [Bacteroidetes bacterium]|nr:hypothetical protein [Bacteroidota bacterium]
MRYEMTLNQKTRLPAAIFCLILVATLAVTPPLQVYATYQITKESFPDRPRTFAEVAGCQLGVILAYYAIVLVIDQTVGKEKPKGENPVEKNMWESAKDALADKFSKDGRKKMAKEH